MGTKIPHSILVHDLLAFEIKQTMAVNLNFNSKRIMDQNGLWNSRFPYKLLRDILLIFGS